MQVQEMSYKTLVILKMRKIQNSIHSIQYSPTSKCSNYLKLSTLFKNR